VDLIITSGLEVVKMWIDLCEHFVLIILILPLTDGWSDWGKGDTSAGLEWVQMLLATKQFKLIVSAAFCF
jgi:hypothetical protein